jgi:hypothetical protein
MMMDYSLVEKNGQGRGYLQGLTLDLKVNMAKTKEGSAKTHARR